MKFFENLVGISSRPRCIVSDEIILDQRFEELTAFLKHQNYPANLIKAGIGKAKEMDRQTARTVKNKT
ncbi:MAG: hypothetical protein AB2693_12515, partial [Candidatus Thiodiazotropha sp.]